MIGGCLELGGAWALTSSTTSTSTTSGAATSCRSVLLACPKGLACIPYSEPGENPAYEHVGLCAVES